MKRSYAIMLVCFSLLLCVMASCISREAAERQGAHTSEAAEYHTVTFYENGMVSQELAVKQGERVSNVPEGMKWRDEAGHTVDFATLAVTEDMAVYAQAPVTVRSEHVRYMTGENNKFRPNDDMTRAEAAQVICNLVEDSGYTPGDTGTFSDVTRTDAAYDSVEEAASLGLMTGYADGTFRPDSPITRGEMVTVLCRVMDVDEIVAKAFEDVDTKDWTMGNVAAAMAKGWLTGYEDGDFYPDAPLTRAEAVVLINRALGKTPNKTAIDLVCETSPYRDVSKKSWAYYDIVDVSFSSELMAYIMGEVPDAQQGFIILGDDLCHINAEKKLDYFQKGFHTITDGLESDGVYYAPDNGYFLQRSKPGLQELDGSLFYVEKEDGPFVSNYDYGYLHFGENGRYTSGDVEVDGYVDAIMNPIIQGNTANLLREDKLREAYNAILFGDYDYMNRRTGWIRGSTGWSLRCAKEMYATKRGSCYYWAASFLYLARRLGFQAYPVVGGVNENNAQHAWVMIDHGAELDDIDVNNQAKLPAAQRQIDPDEYIYDVELDWAYRTGAHGRSPIRPGRDMFKQRRGHSYAIYFFPGDTSAVMPGGGDIFGEEEENNDDLFMDENGNSLVEGVDYTITYSDNGDGTILVTITYLTGSRAGSVVTYTIPKENFEGSLTPTPTDGGEIIEPSPTGGETVDPTPTGGETVDPTPTGSEVTQPSPGTTEPDTPTTDPDPEDPDPVDPDPLPEDGPEE